MAGPAFSFPAAFASTFAATPPAWGKSGVGNHPTKIRKRAQQQRKKFPPRRKKAPKGAWREEVAAWWRARGATEPQVVKMTRMGERYRVYSRASRLQAKAELYEDVLERFNVSAETLTDMMVRKQGGCKELLLQWPEALEIRLEMLKEFAPNIMWAEDVVARHPNVLRVDDIALVARTVRQSDYMQDEVRPSIPEQSLGDVLYLLCREDIERSLRKRDKSHKERAKQKRLTKARKHAQMRKEAGEAKHAAHLIEREPARKAAMREQRIARDVRDVPKRLQEWHAGKAEHLAKLAERFDGDTAKRVA